MSYALPRSSLGPACFWTLTALASSLARWQLLALYVESSSSLMYFLSNKARSPQRQPLPRPPLQPPLRSPAAPAERNVCDMHAAREHSRRAGAGGCAAPAVGPGLMRPWPAWSIGNRLVAHVGCGMYVPAAYASRAYAGRGGSAHRACRCCWMCPGPTGHVQWPYDMS